MVKLFFLRTSRITTAARTLIRIIIEDETEHKREGNEKGDIRENDVEVGAQDFGEHLDVMRNLGFWDNPHKIQVQLHEGKKKCSCRKVLLYHNSIRHTKEVHQTLHCLLRDEGDDDQDDH